MFEIYAKNNNVDVLIFDSFKKNNLISCTITQEINKIDNLSFEYYKDTIDFDFLEFKTILKVYSKKENEYVFLGRVIEKNIEMDKNGVVKYKIVCESELGYLQDSIQEYVAEQEYLNDGVRSGLEVFIDTLLTNHNSQVEDYKKIYVGNITKQTFEGSDGVYKSLNYQTTFECIKSKLLDSFGGEMRLRRVNNVNYLDYAENFDVTTNTTFEISKNIKSHAQEVDITNIATRLIPLGAKIKTETSEGQLTEMEERLTIKSVNNNIIYLENTLAVQKYGIIYKIVEFDDVTDATNLKNKGLQYLEEINTVNVVNKIDALNLYYADMQIDNIKLGYKYNINNKLLDFNDDLKVVKNNIDVLHPYNSNFTLGEQNLNLNDVIYNIKNDINNVNTNFSSLKTSIENEYSSINSRTDDFLTTITQNENNITLKVEEHEQNISDNSTQINLISNILSMDENGTTLIFDNINEDINNVATNLESTKTEILKYIRFEDGNILLGEKDNPLILKIENDKISFLKNGVEMSYWDMTSNYFHVGNMIVDTNEKAQFGNFAFLPRQNGSLSFSKVN